MDLLIAKIKKDIETKFMDTPARYKHILGVVEMSTDLAKKNNSDINKAIIAGLLHDYMKNETTEDLVKLLKKKKYQKIAQKEPFLLHALAAAYIAKRNYKIKDKSILKAIENHVYGAYKMDLLAKIIVISDFAEINRTYAEAKEVRNILEEGNLDFALVKSLEYSLSWLESQKLKPNLKQLKIYQKYEKKLRSSNGKYH